MSCAQQDTNEMQALHKKTYDVAPYLPAFFEEITHAEPAPGAIAVSHLPSMSRAQQGTNHMQALHKKTYHVAPYLPPFFEEITHAGPAPSAIAVSHLPSIEPYIRKHMMWHLIFRLLLKKSLTQSQHRAP